jgi:hypothetical protein
MSKTREIWALCVSRIRAPLSFWVTVPSAALRVIITVCILTTSVASLVGCRSGVRSWEEAIRLAQNELDAAGDLEGRIEGYERISTQLSAKIDLLDQARPGLELIDKLRGVEVPLVGNGWQILLTLMGVVTADGAKIIGRLEEVLRELAELKHSLDYLNGLPAVAEAVGTFRAEPTRRTLLELSWASASATPSLYQMHAEVDEVLNPVDDVSGGLSDLIAGLRNAADADIPVVSDAAREAAERLLLVEEPLKDMRDDLQGLHAGSKADAETLDKIQEIVRQAKELRE